MARYADVIDSLRVAYDGAVELRERGDRGASWSFCYHVAAFSTPWLAAPDGTIGWNIQDWKL